MERHIIAQPALNSAALVIVAAGALRIIFLTALKAIDIELSHVVTNALEVLY